MLCFQVMGNDHAVAMAAQAGQMELNVMMPGMIHAVLQSMQYLVNFLPTFTQRGIRGIEANVERATETVSKNPAIATLLAPSIGYLEAAALAKEAVETNRPVLDLAMEKGVIDEKERRRVLDELGIKD
jgi:aspartate ammonia-lyase